MRQRIRFWAVMLVAAPAMVIACAPISSIAHAQAGQRGMVQMRTAEAQAGLAAAATQLPEVRQHLQQALNCLEGGGGRDYRAAAGDPCARSGAERRLPASSVNRIRVRKAIRLASVGV